MPDINTNWFVLGIVICGVNCIAFLLSLLRIGGLPYAHHSRPIWLVNILANIGLSLVIALAWFSYDTSSCLLWLWWLYTLLGVIGTVSPPVVDRWSESHYVSYCVLSFCDDNKVPRLLPEWFGYLLRMGCRMLLSNVNSFPITGP